MSQDPIGPQGAFTAHQLRKLSRNVDENHIHTRQLEGVRLSYIEGWYAISQANEIFGYGGWDRETVHFERVHERSRGDAAVAGYTARVRIRVRAGGTEVLREGTGWGWATARSIGEAHERALKTAETDATPTQPIPRSPRSRCERPASRSRRLRPPCVPSSRP